MPVRRAKTILSVIAVSVTMACAGCASLWEDYTTIRVPARTEVTSTFTNRGNDVYGNEAEVRGTVDIVKTIGAMSEISRHAVRLPNEPLQSITTFDYEFPENCGGHRFRVYESGAVQILEYDYVPEFGRPYVIRDYVAGPNPFIQAGLWSAYDHTDESIGDMRFQFAKRGSRLLKGTYSQGLVTGLDATTRRALGAAYNRALNDSRACRN